MSELIYTWLRIPSISIPYFRLLCTDPASFQFPFSHARDLLILQTARFDRTVYCQSSVQLPYDAPARSRPHIYQTRSAWSIDQGSNENHSLVNNFASTVTKFCVMWEGLSLPHDTKLGNCRCKIVDSRAFPSWSLIHGLRWSGLIKAEPGHIYVMEFLSYRTVQFSGFATSTMPELTLLRGNNIIYSALIEKMSISDMTVWTRFTGWVCYNCIMIIIHNIVAFWNPVRKSYIYTKI